MQDLKTKSNTKSTAVDRPKPTRGSTPPPPHARVSGPPGAPPTRRPKRISIKALLWKAATLAVIGLVYWTINSEGIRLSMPVFATPLRKLPVPGLSYLRHWESTYRLDLAHLFAIFMLFAVFHLLVRMTRITLFGKDAPSLPKRIDFDVYTKIVFALGVVFVVGDVLLFFLGVRHHAGSWGGANFVIAIVASAIYLAVLVFISFMYVVLETETQNS